MRCVFDIECLINYFLVVFYSVEDEKIYTFEISEYIDQRKELKEFCKNVKLYIGFNNRDYDCPMLEYALSGASNKSLLERSMSIIGKDVPKMRFYTKLPHIDLQIVNHYTIGSPKISSLKKLAFNYRDYEVYDMPVNYTLPVKEVDRKDMEKYCIKDVMKTLKTYTLTREKLEIRRDLGKLFNIDLRNMSDPAMIETVFMKRLGVDKKQILANYQEYDEIRVSELILPFIGSGKFTDIAKRFFNNIVLRPTAKGFVADDNKLYHEYTDDITIKWAMGGVHGAVPTGLYTNKDCIIETCDGASMYPNFILNNNIYPRSLGKKALELYKWFKDERFKYPKGSTLNLGFKLFINLFSGKLKQKFSPIYEPKGNISMVVNCQLMITWLADMVLEAIPGSRLLMINTRMLVF